jgi:hypothetical protein
MIRSLGARSPATPEVEPPLAEEDEGMTIGQMDGRYSTLRPANKPLTRLHVIDRSGRVRTFQYSHLDAESSFDGDTFTLVFAGTRRWRVAVSGHGKLFWAVYDYCTLHRWPYLREATRDFGDPTETVFTRIEITESAPLPVE